MECSKPGEKLRQRERRESPIADLDVSVSRSMPSDGIRSAISKSKAKPIRKGQTLVVILVGTSGSGKGTQTRLPSGTLGRPTISSSEMLRSRVRNGCVLGCEVRDILERGELVSDHLILGILEERLREGDCEQGYILDGIPRTMKQAEFLAFYWIRNDTGCSCLPIIFSFELDDRTLIARLKSRRICPTCSSTCHLVSNPPQTQMRYDLDGSPLEIRNDDCVEVAERRHEDCREAIGEIKDFCRPYYSYIDVDGNRSVQSIRSELLESTSIRKRTGC